MRPRRRLVGLVVVAAALLLFATQARPALPRVLMVTYSAGYQHDVVRRPTAGEPIFSCELSVLPKTPAYTILKQIP